MRWLADWLKTTFAYNPTFPLSALLLLAGLRLLAVGGGALDAGTLGGAAGGVGVLQGYELLLLGAALLVLWPRRIAYETTSILVILGVVRWAAPFVVTGFAADAEDPLRAALLGAAVAGLMTVKVRAVHRGVGLDLRGAERAWDAVLYGVACVGLPLLAWSLADATGRTLGHEAARAAQVAAWWGCALLLAPLARGLPDLGRGPGAARPLGSRRPAAVWRDLGAVAFPLLLGNALWLAGDGPLPVALLPLALVVPAVLLAHARAAGLDPGAWTAWLPAGAVAVAALAPAGWLLGRVPVAPRGVVLLGLLPVAAAAVPLVAPDRVRLGLRAVALAAALAPLAVAPTPHDGLQYLLLLALAAAAHGVVARRGLPLAVGGAAATVLVARLVDHGPSVGPVLLGGSAALAALAAWRRPEGAAPTRAALTLGGLGALAAAAAGATGPAVPLALLDGAALALLGARSGERGPAAGGAAVAAAVALRRLGPALDPGLALVLLAFGAVPLGTWIALRRERRRAEDARPLPLEGPAEVADLEALEVRALEVEAFEGAGGPAPACAPGRAGRRTTPREAVPVA